jgi:hypothetical protein
MTSPSQATNLTAIVTTLENKATKSRVSFGDILKNLKNRGFGPLLVIPAMLVIMPTGAIPGMPIICGLFMIAISAQMAFGMPLLLPKRMLKFSMDKKKFVSALEKIEPVTRVVDKVTHPRLKFLTTPIIERVIAFIIILLSMMIMAVGVIPFAVVPPAFAILLFAVALMSKDGLLMGAGLCVFIAAVYIMALAA